MVLATRNKRVQADKERQSEEDAFVTLDDCTIDGSEKKGNVLLKHLHMKKKELESSLCDHEAMKEALRDINESIEYVKDVTSKDIMMQRMKAEHEKDVKAVEDATSLESIHNIKGDVSFWFKTARSLARKLGTVIKQRDKLIECGKVSLGEDESMEM